MNTETPLINRLYVSYGIQNALFGDKLPSMIKSDTTSVATLEDDLYNQLGRQIEIQVRRTIAYEYPKSITYFTLN